MPRRTTPLLLLLPLASSFDGTRLPSAQNSRRRTAHSCSCTIVDPESSFGRLSEQSSSIRCPFWRTRAYDALDSALGVVNFIAARHKSLDLAEQLSLPVRWMGPKTTGLAIEEVMQIVREDVEVRQYYVTGQLTPGIYSDRCFFDGPDPDMPVRSLARYADALQGLFDPSLSAIELLGMEKVCERSFVARWRLSGALKLPWRPLIKPYLGATLYELDGDGLIVSHNEDWSISALEAFASTIWPSLGAPAAPEAGVLQRDESLWHDLQPPSPRVAASSPRLATSEHGGSARSEADETQTADSTAGVR